MDSHVKVFGHPAHAVLVVYPVALLSAGMACDLAYVATGRDELASAANLAITGGVAIGAAAAALGAFDWRAIPPGTRAKRIGTWHGAGNFAVLGLFGVSLLRRRSRPQYLPDRAPAVLAVFGGALAVMTAWLGAELVYRLGVAVDADAHLDAPNSLARSGLVEIDAA